MGKPENRPVTWRTAVHAVLESSPSHTAVHIVDSLEEPRDQTFQVPMTKRQHWPLEHRYRALWRLPMSPMNVNRITWKPISITVKHLEAEAQVQGTPLETILETRDTVHLVLNGAGNNAVLG